VKREETIFEQALGIEPPDERDDYLREACAGDAEMFERLQGLLRAYDRAGKFLESSRTDESDSNLAIVEPAALPQPTITLPMPTEKAGDRIGRYKLLQRIGEGGCGVVYMAEQEEPVRRRVALKITKLGMDTRQVIARFEAERQALALMDHPNIAKVLDAGATETGRPFFVMELVRGIKITDYCDEKKLSTEQRLELFTQVCRAVQHAHQKGIIHRDLKPSNILVSFNDGFEVPKVIDFGIAKATSGEPLTDKTVFTAFEQFIGTPAYMSPEQALVSSLDIDTRTDIYALGVLLYELLTGRTPFDPKELLQGGIDAMRRTICEKEPERPSTRLSTMPGEELNTTAQRRGLDAPKLVSQLRGDLDWIVMKCLEKDRARRYETANGLASDIGRYLVSEPITARPPSTFYRLQKSAHRHKAAFVATAIVVVVLMFGTAVSTTQAIRATRAKAQALKQKKRADEEAAKQEAINLFLGDMLASADPTAASLSDPIKGRQVTVLEVLGSAAAQLDHGGTKDHPMLEAAIRLTLGRTYLSLRQPVAAEPQLLRALELSRRIYGDQSESVAECLVFLSDLRGQQGLEERENLAREAVELERRLHAGDHDHVARGLTRLGDIFNARVRGGNPEFAARAEASYREALAIQRRLPAAANREFARTLSGLGRHLIGSGKTDAEVERLLKEALQIQKAVLGPRHPDVARTLVWLADLRDSTGNYSEAEELCKQAISIHRERLGPKHFDLSTSLFRLGSVLEHQKMFQGSEAAFGEALVIRREAMPMGLDVAWTLFHLARTEAGQGRLAEAEAHGREALDIRDTVTTEDVASDAYWLFVRELAEVLRLEKKQEQVETLYRHAMERQGDSLQPDDWMPLKKKSRLAGALLAQKRHAEAEPLAVAAYEGLKQRETNIPPAFKGCVKESLERVVQIYEEWGRQEKAIEWREKATKPK
jgi:serine/threonine protein kinase